MMWLSWVGAGVILFGLGAQLVQSGPRPGDEVVLPKFDPGPPVQWRAQEWNLIINFGITLALAGLFILIDNLVLHGKND